MNGRKQEQSITIRVSHNAAMVNIEQHYSRMVGAAAALHTPPENDDEFSEAPKWVTLTMTIEEEQ